MGTLTAGDLLTEIDRNAGRRSTGPDSVDNAGYLQSIRRIIDQVQVSIARTYDFSELKKVDSVTVSVTGTPAVDAVYTGLPANIRNVFSLVRQETGGSGQKLTYIPQREWDQKIGSPAELITGSVVAYTIWNNSSGALQVEWYRVPNEAFTLVRRYTLWPTPIGETNNPSDLDNKDDLIIAWASEWLLRSLGELTDATEWKKTRKELLQAAIEDDSSKPDISFIPRGASDNINAAPVYWKDPFVRRSP